MGIFAYYAQWVPCFSEKIKPFIATKEFPLREEALQALKTLKQDLTSDAFNVIDERLPLVLETDASDNAISATLNQEGRPVAFFSRTLNKCELHQSSVEKEACAIVEAIRKWAHLLCINSNGKWAKQLYSVQPLPSCTTVLKNVPIHKNLHHNHI